jgi:hypothetical protein
VIVKVVQLNWRDNPKFPAVLERQRLRDLAERPDGYNHIWEGDYATVVDGAYYAKFITAAVTRRGALPQAEPAKRWPGSLGGAACV